jgi:hypothetical protein
MNSGHGFAAAPKRSPTRRLDVAQHQSGKETSATRVRIHLALLAWLTILLIAASLPSGRAAEPQVKLTSATLPAHR